MVMKRFYLDTEWSFEGGILMSLALVKDDGRSLYLINADNYAGEDKTSVLHMDPWVEENVYPILRHCPVTPYVCALDRFGSYISDFIYHEEGHPQIIADWPRDIAYLMEMFMAGERKSVKMGAQTHMTVLRHIDVYPTDVEGAIRHNAWWDAMALKRFCELGVAA